MLVTAKNQQLPLYNRVITIITWQNCNKVKVIASNGKERETMVHETEPYIKIIQQPRANRTSKQGDYFPSIYIYIKKKHKQ